MTSKNNMAKRYATTHESGRVLRQPDEAPQLTNLERQETDATTLTLHAEIIQKNFVESNAADPKLTRR